VYKLSLKGPTEDAWGEVALSPPKSITIDRSNEPAIMFQSADEWLELYRSTQALSALVGYASTYFARAYSVQH